MLITIPDSLTAETITISLLISIGAAYKIKYGANGSYIHTNADIADKLTKINHLNATPLDVWHYFIENFSALKKQSGSLADTMIAVFEKAFGVKVAANTMFDATKTINSMRDQINIRFNQYAKLTPDKLTNDMLNKLGEDYLQTHKAETMFHSNHDSANRLKQYATHNDLERVSTPQEKWEFFISVFRDLPKIDGSLAKSMLHCFNGMFKVQVINTSTTDPIVISGEMKKIMQRYFERLDIQESVKLHAASSSMLAN